VGDLVDVVLIVTMVGFAVSGYRQGFLVGAVSFLGFIGGGVVGAKVAPAIAGSVTSDARNEPLVAIVVVFAAAVVGQLLVTPLGVALRRRVSWKPVELLDSTTGAAVSVLGVLLVAWLIGTAIAHSPYRALARQVQHSRIETAVNSVMPDSASTWFAQFQRVFDRSGFPQVFGGLGPEPIRNVRPPDPALRDSPAVELAHDTVVEVVGAAPSCGRQVQGTGFVYAPGHVLTNAHVVAGVRGPTVAFADGPSYPAKVVLYDPDLDIAVLSVPQLPASVRPLRFASRTLSAGDGAVVVGYPQGGPFHVEPARVRGAETVRGPNIYQDRRVTREIYALRSTVRPGNSGGPLLTRAGDVVGVVFAASYDDPDTGYALTDRTVMADATRGRALTAEVATGDCTSE
jgi:S1-C subfamily serine protease